MAPRVGPTEAERHQIIGQMKAGASFEAVKESWAKMVEGEWFELNREHLAEVLEKGDIPKPSPASLVPHQAEPAAPDPVPAPEPAAEVPPEEPAKRKRTEK